MLPLSIIFIIIGLVNKLGKKELNLFLQNEKLPNLIFFCFGLGSAISLIVLSVYSLIINEFQVEFKSFLYSTILGAFLTLAYTFNGYYKLITRSESIRIHKIGDKFSTGYEVPISGTYRCVQCNQAGERNDLSLNQYNKFPPCTRCQDNGRQPNTEYELLLFIT